MFLMVRIKVQKRRGYTFPVPVWVVNEFLTALTDLVWIGEMALKRIPLPKDERSRQQMSWVKTVSPSGIITGTQMVIKDLCKYKGLDIVDVKTADVQVKISLK
ncbi:hypothetical protein Desmer_3143 [Desulfosporosinus meridiei DSM 13257]|uniref:Uncharacterized protein n=1 Tax=Desulfosporosinus meridiei (strain ATCC BAA-275 / DSM 13257 / KCTC 12902 / NCIMB 13706 / S10) TaxID=768704 RepID=J7ITJ0_DESMD|nr:hypothetical protein Desmer_3143 [Desulfosporosinus meridiei DSM 13257]